KVDIGERLAVPKSAVMDTGMRSIVFVKAVDGSFETREVSVGDEAGGYYEIVKGLSPGEEVVVSGNFFVDSEAQLTSTAGSGAGQ
ncbi:MAG: efflux RND transporter periplasmic adaptor subunit, partial [Candidatus Omnitrophica bacterium]|nr:efflux RND transporter periplasmic adaptor subunit [Candidatus Omnitrophota bacterium]